MNNQLTDSGRVVVRNFLLAQEQLDEISKDLNRIVCLKLEELEDNRNVEGMYALLEELPESYMGRRFIYEAIYRVNGVKQSVW